MSKYSRVSSSPGDDSEAQPTVAPPPAPHQQLYQHFKESFESLSTCPRELYVNFFLKFCESYGYFSISQILVIYLHNEFGASDIRAGGVYGTWGAAITFWGLMISWLNDNFGVRNSLLMGFTISLISSLLLATATSINTIYAVLFCLMPMGTAMGIPMLTVGIKRYTNRKNRGFAFGLYYSIMNVAAFVSGPVVDIFNIGFKSGITVFGRHWTGNRLVILSTTCTYTASLVVTYFFLREIRVHQLPEDEEAGGSHDSSQHNSHHGSQHSNAERLAGSGVKRDQVHRHPSGDIEHGIELTGMPHTAEDATDTAQYRNEGGPSRDIAHGSPLHRRSPRSRNGSEEVEHHSPGHIDGRIQSSAHTGADHSAAVGEAGTGAGLEVAVAGENYETFVPEQRNLAAVWSQLVQSPTFWRFSVLTLFLINLNTIFRHLDATLPTYLVRCFGASYPKGMIYSINPFIIMWLTPVIAALTSAYAHYDMIKYGGYVSALSPFFMVMATETWAVVLFVVFLSLGEAIWSPRVYDYTMSIAPEGREASFSTLATAPLFAAKVPVGLLSGYLVSTYLPQDGTRPDGRTLWLIVGLLTLTSPILITLFEPCVREPPKAKTGDPSTPSSSSARTASSREDADGTAVGNPLVGGDRSRGLQQFTIGDDDDEGEEAGRPEEQQRYVPLHASEAADEDRR